MRLDVLNRIRGRIPYEYWLLYDCVIVSLLIHGWTHHSWIFAVGLPFVAVAMAFDIVEFIVKRRQRHPYEYARAEAARELMRLQVAIGRSLIPMLREIADQWEAVVRAAENPE